MDNEPSISQVVTDLLAARKTLAGHASWQDTNDLGEVRATWPVMVGDEIPPGVTVAVNYYPDAKPPRYSISLNAPKSVFRVDWEEDKKHTNSFKRPSDLAESEIRGPHCHTWLDNQLFCTAHSLPDELLNARYLPDNLRGFENVFRWFLGQVGIDQPANDLIGPPRRSKLL